MEAERIKTRSELLHRETATKYTAAMSRMKQLEKKLKRTINKSKYAPINLLNTQAFSENVCACNSLCLTCLMLIAHKMAQLLSYAFLGTVGFSLF